MDLDVRGTTVGADLLGQILGVLSGPSGGRPRIGSARCDLAEFNGDARFDGAEFISGALFNDAKFSGSAGFEGAKFRDVAAFGRAKFAGEARFEFAEFSRLTVFEFAMFSRIAMFDGATFSDYAHFRNALFRGEARFGPRCGGAKFGRDAVFIDARFAGDARFDSVRVEGDLWVGPSVIGGTLFLDGVRVGGMARVVASAEVVRCGRGEFGGRVWLSLWGGELWLADSAFAGPVTVESSLEPPSSLGQGEVWWNPPQVALRSLRGTDAEHLTLVDVDLSRCVLSGLRRPELLRLDGRCAFTPMPRGWHRRRLQRRQPWQRPWPWPWRWMAREALFEEHLWRRSTAGQGDGWAEPDPGQQVRPVVGPARLAVLYRQLRGATEDARNEPGAADLYYGEMEMRRLGAVRRGERWLLSAYWLVSGYGLRAGRALVALLVLVAMAAVALGFGGFVGRAPGFGNCVLYAAGSVVSLDVVAQHVPSVLTGWGEVVRIVLRVGGPVLLGLAALAVRGRVKR